MSALTASEKLSQRIFEKQTCLCVGLDTDINKLPASLLSSEDPVFAFNKAIIDATLEHCVAYKPNLAFYEALGAEGWASLQKTIDYIPESHLIIADAKRGDIGNTSGLYAKAFFEKMGVDAVTLAPYMGLDSVSPFLSYKNKWVILLALTSNQSAEDFETLSLENGKKVYEEVLTRARSWANEDQLMFVVGATKSTALTDIRKLIPDHFLLVPGVGAQGGSLEEVMEYGMNTKCGLLINSSRGIIYASSGDDFAAAAKVAASKIHNDMKTYLQHSQNF